MGLFKNNVGRPSNDTLKKRRIIYLAIIFVAVIGIGASVFYTVNYFKNSNVSGTEKNVSMSDLTKRIFIANRSGDLYTSDGSVMVNKNSYIELLGNQGIDVKFPSSKKAVLNFKIQFQDGIKKGKVVGKKRYYYTLEVTAFDKNGKRINSTKEVNIKTSTITQDITITGNTAKIGVSICSANAKHDQCNMWSVKVEVMSTYSDLSSIFPDSNFRQCVLDSYNKAYKTSKDYLIPSELEKITKIDCENSRITNTVGIETLKGLTTLYLLYNKITEIDLNKNTKLTRLWITESNLTSIDLSKNTKLTYLDLSGNKITSINLSNNKNLDDLDLAGNKITSINLSNNTKLKKLSISKNNLSSIDLSKNTKITHLNLSENKISSINLSKNKNLELIHISNNKISSIDLSKNKKIKGLKVLTGNPIKKANIKLPNGVKLDDILEEYVTNIVF